MSNPSEAALLLSLDHVSPATRLLEKRRQMLEVQQALEEQKREYFKQEEHFRQQEEKLRKKDLELQEALVLFNRFLKENEAKKRRAEKRADEQARQVQVKDTEIVQRKATLKKQRERCARLRRRLERNEQYRQFIHDVQHTNTVTFADLDAVLKRYGVLRDAHDSLRRRQDEVAEQLESKRQEFVQYNKDMYNKNLALNNRIASLSKVLEEQQKFCVAKESEVDERIDRETERTLKLSQIRMAIDNLFERLVTRESILKHEQTVNFSLQVDAKDEDAATSPRPGDTPKAARLAREEALKLDVVANYFTDYADIYSRYQRRHGDTTGM